MINPFTDTADLLYTQDNRMTSHPIYQVLQGDPVANPISSRCLFSAFTHKAAVEFREQFLRRMENSSVDPDSVFIYVDSAHRNAEWRLARLAFLLLGRMTPEEIETLAQREAEYREVNGLKVAGDMPRLAPVTYYAERERGDDE